MTATIEIHERASIEQRGARLAVRVIAAGWNLSGSRFYTAQALQSAIPLFEGARMHRDHPTASEEHERPEGSIATWVGVLRDARWTGDAIEATSHVFDRPFAERLREMAAIGELGAMGVSIRAHGEVGEQMTNPRGGTGDCIVKLVSVLSVDFVTLPGAGGQVHAILESHHGAPATATIYESLRTRGYDRKTAAILANGGTDANPYSNLPANVAAILKGE